MKCIFHKENNTKKNRRNVKRFISYSVENGSPWCFFLLLTILINAGVSLGTVLMPRMIVKIIQQNRDSIMRIAMYILGVELILCILRIFSIIEKGKLKICSDDLFRCSYAELALKQGSLPYSQSVRGSNLDLLENGKYGIWDIPPLSEVMEKFGSSFSSLIINILIVCLYDWKLLVLPIAVIFVLKPLYDVVMKVEIDNAKRLLPENRAFGWYCRLISDFRYGEDIRVFAVENLLLIRCSALMKKIYRTNHAAYMHKGVIVGIIRFLLQFQVVCVAVFIAIRCMSGMRMADFVLLFSAVSAISACCNDVIEGISRINKLDALLEPFFEFIDQKSENICSAENVDDDKKTFHQLCFENVTFSYPGQASPALKNVSFRINTGEKIAIVGTNGAGKSTITKLLCRMYVPQSGRITIDEMDISKYSFTEYQKIITTLFQDFQLLPVRICENVVCKKSEDIMEKDIVQIRRLLSKTDMITWVDSLPEKENTYISPNLSETFVNPSGGQSQYLALIRSAYKQAAIYVFDEPTMALDIEMEHAVMQMLEKLSGDNTCIMISHRLSHTKNMDRIIVMDSGKIVEMGTHKNLMAHDNLYKRMYDNQAKKYGVVSTNGIG